MRGNQHIVDTHILRTCRHRLDSFRAAWAVSCFECDSLNDSKCGDDFEPDDIAKTDCDSMELPEDKRVFYLQRPETACLIKYYGGICK